jgi:NADH-quinone oxidoreductase subunit N
MYFKAPTEEFEWIKMSAPVVASIVIAVVGVLYMGILPGGVIAMAKNALF